MGEDAGGSVTAPIFNVSRRKVGGIWFVKLGRINLSFSVSRPKSILEVQRMDCTTHRGAVDMDALYRALKIRAAELNATGATMEVNCDH